LNYAALAEQFVRPSVAAFTTMGGTFMNVQNYLGSGDYYDAGL
jgi:hypothetical protein